MSFILMVDCSGAGLTRNFTIKIAFITKAHFIDVAYLISSVMVMMDTRDLKDILVFQVTIN
jgi:hypothetical protein